MKGTDWKEPGQIRRGTDTCEKRPKSGDQLTQTGASDSEPSLLHSVRKYRCKEDFYSFSACSHTDKTLITILADFYCLTYTL